MIQLRTGELPSLSAPNAPPSLLKFAGHFIATTIFLVSLGPLVFAESINFALKRNPVPSWTLGRLLYHKILRLGIVLFLGYQLPRPASYDEEAKVSKSTAKKSGITVSTVTVPAVAARERIAFARCVDVDAVDRPGFMITPEGAVGRTLAPAVADERVIFYIVGGAFITGHPLRTSFASSSSGCTKLRLFAVNYRKALDAATAFPAPLLDVVAGFKFLVTNLGFSAQNIIIMGDSAGANLSLALCRYLVELEHAGVGFGLPRTLLLNSPWADMTSSLPSCVTNKSSDYVGGIGHLAVPSYIRHFPSSVTHPYFSPALADPKDLSYFKGMKVYAQVGTRELLYDEGVTLLRKLREAGAETRLREDVDGSHCNAVLGYRDALRTWCKDICEVLQIT